MPQSVPVSPPQPGLRGDYRHARPDYSVAQDWQGYSADEHALWQMLYARQMRLAKRYACPEFLAALAQIDSPTQIPRFDHISKALRKATGWELVPVPGLIPDETFFTHLAARRFPVTVWLRKPEEFDYIVEPDVFHDFFGHVPLLFDPVYADHLQAYGAGGLKALPLRGLTYLARLYWYTIEFGLIRTPEGLRAYGAGLLSSSGELPHALDSTEPKRIAFDLMRVMRSPYRIDDYQPLYFVIDDFAQLLRETAPDFTPFYAQLQDMPAIPVGEQIDGDRRL